MRESFNIILQFLSQIVFGFVISFKLLINIARNKIPKNAVKRIFQVALPSLLPSCNIAMKNINE